MIVNYSASDMISSKLCTLETLFTSFSIFSCPQNRAFLLLINALLLYNCPLHTYANKSHTWQGSIQEEATLKSMYSRLLLFMLFSDCVTNEQLHFAICDRTYVASCDNRFLISNLCLYRIWSSLVLLVCIVDQFSKSKTGN